MTFIVTIKCDGMDDLEFGVYMALSVLARRVISGDDFNKYRTLYDSEGNDIGRAAFKDIVRVEATP